MPAAPRPTAPVATAPAHSPPRPVVPGGDAIVVEYVERSSIRVRGPVTGALYHFSGAKPLQRVDRRDAPALLATRHFTRRG